MAKMLIDSKTLEDLANALRSVTGETRSYTPTEMIEAVTNIMETGTYIIVDKNGNEIPAVFVDNEQSFTATANDIRIGTTAVTEAGVTVGEKEIPAYYTTEGYRVISAGSDYTITFLDDNYDFTKIQAIICPYDSTITNSVVSEKVVIGENVYAVNSKLIIATLSRNANNQSIELNIKNDTNNLYVLRYFTYKEVL